MALCNHSTKEISFKVVYCGTSKSGKTTNLSYIHNKLDSHFRGGLVSLPGDKNRSQRYELLPIKGGIIEGYQSSMELYTYPGSNLEGVDGIIFVVDSTPDRMIENLEALQSTRQELERCGMDPDSIPFVFQFNKQDLATSDPQEIDEFLGISAPSVLTCALSGYQVFETLDIITEIVLNNFHVSDVMRREQIEEEVIDNSSNIALSS